MFYHSKILLSFIIPTVNDPRIEETIVSVIKSIGWSPRDCELIVIVNNCPKYFYEKLCNKFSSLRVKENVKILYLKKTNISQARNLGIKASQGQYVVHIDSDCKLSLDYIEKLKKHLSMQKVIIGRGTIRFIPSDNLLSRANCELKRTAYFTREEMVYTPNLIIKKEVYKKVGLFDEKLFHGEDTEWSERLKNLQIKPLFLNNLIIEHTDHKNIFKILLTYFYYGIGRAYRFKKYVFSNNPGLKKLNSFYLLFNAIPNLRAINSAIIKLIIFFLYLVRDIGVIYGLFKWKKVE